MKKRMVTRTIKVDTYSVMCCNTETAEVETREYSLYYKPKNKDILRVLQETYEQAPVKFCAVVDSSYKEIKYEMPEDMFVRLANPVIE